MVRLTGSLEYLALLYAAALRYFVLPSEVILTGTEGVTASLSYSFESRWLFIALYSEHRTYTVRDVVGGHSGEAFRTPRTVVTHEELPDMVAAVERADPDCFYHHHGVEGTSRRYYIAPIG